MERSVYCRPEKPKHLMVTPAKERKPSLDSEIKVNKVQPIFVHSSSECHVTPCSVANRMVEALGITQGKLLEPQGGTGNLVASALSAGWCDKDITVIEKNYNLVESLRTRFNDTFVDILHSCFIEYTNLKFATFDAILSNPPFKSVYAHIRSELKVLKVGGVLVALVPSTFNMPGFELVEDLPCDTFELVKVNTKIVRYQRLF